MNQQKKFLVSCYFKREGEAQDLVFVVSCENHEAAEKRARQQVKLIDSKAKIEHVAARELNAVLLSPLYQLSEEDAEKVEAL